MLMLSRMFLLIMPISDLLGFINLQVGLFKKSGLWSFIVMKESLHADVSIRMSSPRLSAIFLSSKEIAFGTLGLVVVACFVRFNVFVFANFFKILAEFSQKAVGLMVGFKLNVLDHLKHIQSS